MNPYVFIVGCPRSGTTLLKRMIDAHPLIAIIPGEAHWITRLAVDPDAVDQDGLARPVLARKLGENSRFSNLGVTLQELEALTARPIPYADLVTKLFDRHGTARGKTLVGNKTPSNVLKIAMLHRLWPNAKVVQLIRDGRDVALSALAWKRTPNPSKRFRTWEAEPVLTAALWWEYLVRLGREAGGHLPTELYLEVRYEALVEDPETACREICAFLGIDHDPAMIRFHEGRVRRDPGLDAKHAWLPPTPGLRDWRSQMAGSDLERFEAAAGDLLEELGYPRGVARLSAEATRAAAACRALFTERARTRGWDLPARWGAIEETAVG